MHDMQLQIDYSLRKNVLSFYRVIEFLRNFEFRNWNTMRGELMLPDSISEEKLEID